MYSHRYKNKATPDLSIVERLGGSCSAKIRFCFEPTKTFYGKIRIGFSVFCYSFSSTYKPSSLCSCTKMAAMLAMTATVVSINADILSCSFLCSNALRL